MHYLFQPPFDRTEISAAGKNHCVEFISEDLLLAIIAPAIGRWTGHTHVW
jgi:hypothetical protein